MTDDYNIEIDSEYFNDDYDNVNVVEDTTTNEETNIEFE